MQKSRQSLLRPAPLAQRRKRRSRLLQRPGKPLPKRLLPSAPHLLLPGVPRVPRAQRTLHPPLARPARQQSAQPPRPRPSSRRLRPSATRPSSRRLRPSVAQRRIVHPLRRPRCSQALATGDRPRRRSVLTRRRVVSKHSIQRLQFALPRLPGPRAEAEQGILAWLVRQVQLARLE